jgi:hypothetical protein
MGIFKSRNAHVQLTFFNRFSLWSPKSKTLSSSFAQTVVRCRHWEYCILVRSKATMFGSNDKERNATSNEDWVLFYIKVKHLC